MEGGQNEEECKNVVFPNAAVSPLFPDFPRKSKNEEKKENRLVKYVLGRGGRMGLSIFETTKEEKSKTDIFSFPLLLPPPPQ